MKADNSNINKDNEKDISFYKYEMDVVEDEKEGIIKINIGPSHPATHGTLKLTTELNGEKIIGSVPEIGFLHSGFEKLAEHHTYNQWITVTDRMNYLSPLNNNIGYAIAVEELLE